MGLEDDIREAHKRLSSTVGPKPTLQGKVTNVDETNMIASIVDSDDLPLPDIRLRNVLDEKQSVVLIPKVGIWVLAVRIEEDEDWMLLYAAEVVKVKFFISDSIQLEMNPNGILMNGGTLDGLVILSRLVAKLNVIESQLNVLRGVFGAWSPVTETALKTALATFIAQTITPTIKSDLENTKVKQ